MLLKRQDGHRLSPVGQINYISIIEATPGIKSTLENVNYSKRGLTGLDYKPRTGNRQRPALIKRLVTSKKAILHLTTRILDDVKENPGKSNLLITHSINDEADTRYVLEVEYFGSVLINYGPYAISNTAAKMFVRNRENENLGMAPASIPSGLIKELIVTSRESDYFVPYGDDVRVSNGKSRINFMY